MNVTLSRRGAVRIVCFSLAFVLTLTGLAMQYRAKSMKQQQILENQLMQTMSDLTLYASNVRSDLEKIQYVNTSPMLTTLSANLWREASFAKEALDQLPISQNNMTNTNKLLSQIGDYCVSLSKKFSEGEPLTDEERSNLSALCDYCDQMIAEIAAFQNELQTGSIDYDMIRSDVRTTMQDGTSNVSVAEGFAELEEGFSGYPTLIYDGPFSDHILTQTPRALIGESDVLPTEALKTAQSACANDASLRACGMEFSRMPSWCFEGDGIYATVTQWGGYLCTMTNDRIPEQSIIDADKAIKQAQAYLESLGYQNMKSSYYEITGNILTANFAAVQDGVILYPDLIKVGVALDNGEVLSLDARGYLMNHTNRSDITPTLSRAEAQKSVSSQLSVSKANLCVIPSDGLTENLCWEFSCKANDGTQILVYINAQTGMEEQLLILLVDENGQLTI